MTDTVPAELDLLSGEDADLVLDDGVEDPAAHLEDANEARSVAMFEGDVGTLYAEQRRCLHALLKHRYISADRHPEQWAVLIANEELIKSRLNDLFLDLHVERGFQIAFKYQAKTDTDEGLPSLLRDISHTKEETIVMIYLRQRFFAQRQEGEDVVFVDRQSLLEEVAGHRPEDATHRAMDQKRADNAIAALASAGLLLKTPDVERFRISPIIEVLLPVEKLRALLTWFMTQNNPQASSADFSEAQMDVELDLLVDSEENDA